MLSKFGTAGAGPSTCKTTALAAIIASALVGDAVVLLERVLAEALEVIGAVRGNIVETSALALGCRTRRFFASGCKVVVVLELVIAEALCLRTDHLAILSPLVAPR